MIVFNYQLTYPSGVRLTLKAEIPSGEIVSVVGSSGSGKSTLAGLMAGLLTPDSAYCRVGGVVFDDSARGVRLSAQERSTGFVFQAHRLFPAMTVRQNILYPLVHGHRKPIMEFETLVRMLHIEDLCERLPATLSGGQAQRVSLARAISAAEHLLIMDEATASLDPRLRDELVGHIAQLHRQTGLSILYITHSAREALALSQTALLIESGQVTAVGRTQDVVERLNQAVDNPDAIPATDGKMRERRE